MTGRKKDSFHIRGTKAGYNTLESPMVLKINQFTNEFGIKQVHKDPASEVEGWRGSEQLINEGHTLKMSAL